MTALALWTLCSAGSCQKEVHSVSALRPDLTYPERFKCELAGTRPTIAPTLPMNWKVIGEAASVAEAVERAQSEHRKFVDQVNARERIVAGYVLLVEDSLFLCYNNMTWQKDFYAGLGQSED